NVLGLNIDYHRYVLASQVPQFLVVVGGADRKHLVDKHVDHLGGAMHHVHHLVGGKPTDRLNDRGIDTAKPAEPDPAGQQVEAVSPLQNRQPVLPLLAQVVVLVEHLIGGDHVVEHHQPSQVRSEEHTS